MLRNMIFDLFEKVTVGVRGPMFQRWGRSLIATGLRLQGSPHYEERRSLE